LPNAKNLSLGDQQNMAFYESDLHRFSSYFLEKCKSKIIMHVKSTMLYRKWSLITTVTGSERREHPAAFTYGSPDFKCYAAS
jgi:hypothetical protein